MKHRKKRRAGMAPQHYEHRVQVAIEALSAALSGAQLLAVFLTEQLGTEWTNQGPKATQAAQEFRRACRWIKIIDRHD